MLLFSLGSQHQQLQSIHPLTSRAPSIKRSRSPAPWPQNLQLQHQHPRRQLGIHPNSSPRREDEEEKASVALLAGGDDGRAGGEAGARAAAVQQEHRRAHRGGVHPLPRARRRRAGGAGDQLAEGARYDVPQGRVGAGRVHGRRRPPRGPGGGRRPRSHRADARQLVLQEPPLRPDLRGHHVPPPRHRRAPPVARDGLPQAHLGDGAASHGRMPTRLDAGGARPARREAREREAAVRAVTAPAPAPRAVPARKRREHVERRRRRR